MGNSHAIWDHTVLPATRQRWESRLNPQPTQVLDLATPEVCKAELTYVTWKQSGRELYHSLSVASRTPYCWATTQHSTGVYCVTNSAVLCDVQMRTTWRTVWHVWLTHLMFTSLVFLTCDHSSRLMLCILLAGMLTCSCCFVGCWHHT